MSTDETRLRGKRTRLQSSWPLGSLPRKVIIGIGRQLVHRMAVGLSDITGDDFGTIFANAVEGVHLSSPLGVADVVLDNNAWSVKTVKANTPFNQKTVRLISGRNSPDYSLGIENPHTDIQATGKAILSKCGLHSKENVKLACISCNRSKGAKLPMEAAYQMV